MFKGSNKKIAVGFLYTTSPNVSVNLKLVKVRSIKKEESNGAEPSSRIFSILTSFLITGPQSPAPTI